jgi:hypothetical protein
MKLKVAAPLVNGQAALKNSQRYGGAEEVGMVKTRDSCDSGLRHLRAELPAEQGRDEVGNHGDSRE